MRNLIVIGAGPAGVMAALTAARTDPATAVTLITAEPVGGRATWHSLVPSKVLLTAADHLDDAFHNPGLGLAGPPPHPDLPGLRDRVARIAGEQSGRDREALVAAGVQVVAGTARFVAARKVTVTAADGAVHDIAFDKAIIASGSVPIFPSDLRPDGKRILAPRLAGKLADWPEHMLVVGGGVTGAEFAYFFARMGTAVTWVTDLDRFLPRSDPDLVAILTDSLVARGVTLLTGAAVAAARAEDGGVTVRLADGRDLAGSHAFLALGRRADTADLDAAAAGITTEGPSVVVNPFGTTSNPDVYAVGDVTGPPFVANRGEAQAQVTARHAVGATTRPFHPELVVEAVYSRPQVAQVGLTEQDAAAAGRPVRIGRARYGDALKPRLSGEPAGLVKVIADAEEGRILGGGAAGDAAADVVAPVAVAIAGGLTIADLATVGLAYPSLSQLVGLAAQAA